jgi:peptidyl-prolyl cis-trans isomerase SurA
MRMTAGISLVAAVAIATAASSLTAQPSDPIASMRKVDVDRVVAIVGRRAVLFSEVIEQINIARARGMQVPRDSAGQMAIARDVLNQMIDEELLIAVARDYNLTVPESDVGPAVDQNLQEIRGRFRDEAEFRTALAREGYGTPEEYRRKSVEEATRQRLQSLAVDTLRALGRMAPVNVTEAEVQEAFERLRSQLGPRPATVSFRQIVVSATPSDSSRARSRALTDSLRAALDAGADFDSVAKAFSEDGSAQLGGDLGWQRRGVMVKPFEDMMFALIPGRISPVVETEYGYHVIRVDRVRPGEVRARHILIMPDISPADVEIARVRADSALALWKAGTPYDSLVSRFHTTGEERTIPEGVPVDSLPVEYRLALRPLATGDFSEVFSLPERGANHNKWVLAQVIVARAAGEYSIDEYQERVRTQLKQEKSTRRTLDALRREYYVSVRM